MLDRNRDARRGSMAAVNGSGLSRRRQQRSTNLRDSPEEDGAMEMQESSRLRDRGVKKDRDRDRDRSSSRSKRRRGERLMHGSNREEGDDSSEESMEDDEEEEEEEEASVAVRLPAAANSSAMPSPSSLIQQQNQHHVRKSGFSASKPVRPPAASWKVADEMIGVSIPRKARTSSLKRPQEYSVSGGGGSGELIHRQASTSPARPSPSSTTAISPPSSSNVPVRKKKPISGTKHRPPKMVKSPSTIQEIEIEVAEVLYGMTRQAPPPATSKLEGNKVDSKDTNGLSTDAKSRVSSPNSFSQTPATSQPSAAPSSNLPMVATAPKRKRPRLRFDEESPASPASPASSIAPSNKMDSEMPKKTEEATSPRSEKNTSASPVVESVIGSGDPSGPVTTQKDLAKPETGNQGSAADGRDQGKVKEEVATLSSKSKDASCVESIVNPQEATAATEATIAASANEGPREEKFSIDLMALPLPEKSSSDRDGLLDFVPDHKSLGPEKKEIANGEVEKVEGASKHEGTSGCQNAEHFLSEEFELKKPTSKEKIPGLQLDLEKHDKEGLSLSCSSKQQQQLVSKQQQKSGRAEPNQEKPAPPETLPLPVRIAGWPGGFPPFGYMGQVPSLQAVVPMDGNSGAAKTVQQPPHFLQPQMRPKRCATHCYIAQNIAYHQQISRMGPFWSTPAAAAVGVAPLYGAKQYNLNAMPPSESAAILGNPLQGGFPPRSMGPLQDKSAPAVAMAYTGPPLKERNSVTAAANSNNYVEAVQRKQFLLQQTPQPGSSAAPPNMMHGPALIFQPAMANRPGGASKSTPGTTGNAAPSAASSSSATTAGSGAAGHPAATMSFNYAGLSPSDAQYMAILQNNGILQNNAYPFPIAAAQIGAPQAYRGASPAQAMPFFNGPFYSSQMVPSQQQQQQLMQQQQQHQQQQHRQHQHQPPAHSQQGHQNPSTSSGSSSSQKHTQQSQRVPGSGASVAPLAGSNSHGFPASKQQLHLLPHQVRQLESETGCEDSPSTGDSSRALQAQKGLYGQNFALPMHSQNFALISSAAAAFAAGASSAAGGSHSESKQSGAHQQQVMKMELTPSQAQAAQAYAMSFASFTGAAAAAQGFDFSSIVQNPVLLQNMTESAKHGYQIPAAAVATATAAAQAAQHKKGHHEDGKSRGDSSGANANVSTEEKKITVAGGGKNAGSVGGQHSLSFSRADNDPTIANFTTILADSNHRMLNGSRPMIPPSSAAPTSSSAAAATSSLSSQQSQQQQQQQQMIQFQKQHQKRLVQLQQQQQQHQHQHQHLQLQQQITSRPSKSSAAHAGSSNVSSDRLPAGSATMAARFPQGGLASFPPSLIQGSSGGSAQSPHWKSSGRAATPAPASSVASSSSSAKNQMPQQQQQQLSRSQQPLLAPGAHQTQISFGVTSSNKPDSNPPLSSATAAAIAAGSPQNCVTKSSAAAGAAASGGSPRASSSSKSGQPPASVLPTLPLQQQQSAAAAAAKNSPSAASGLKSLPNINNNRNMASILGHPHISPSNSSSNKLQQQQQQSQQQQQQLQKQSFQQPQLFFNNAYIQAQTSQSNAAAAAAGYFQQHRRQSEQQQQKNSTTSGMLTMCPSSLTQSGANATSDPTKAAASGIKGLSSPTQAGILQHTAQYTAATSMTPHPFMSAAFSCLNTMPSSVSVKPASAAAADQKQSTTGNENMHACWKPEKR